MSSSARRPGPLTRGRVYSAELSNIEGRRYFLVVSNNIRNRQLGSVLAVRLTTTPKPVMPSIVELGDPEVFTGRVLCDDVIELFEDEIRADLGALTPAAMLRVDAGLRAALDL